MLLIPCPFQKVLKYACSSFGLPVAMKQSIGLPSQALGVTTFGDGTDCEVIVDIGQFGLGGIKEGPACVENLSCGEQAKSRLFPMPEILNTEWAQVQLRSDILLRNILGKYFNQ